MNTEKRRRLGMWLLTGVGVALLAAVVRAQCIGLSANAANVQNLRQLSRAVQLYAQDYDETLPPAENAAVFRAAVLPYSRDPSVFVSPATGLPYAINPVLSRRRLASFDTPGSVQVARDPKGVPTELRLNGDVYQNGVFQPQANADSQCVGNMRRVALGVAQYVQDYDETFPMPEQMTVPDKFRDAILPYVRDRAAFVCPVTSKLYLPNKSLGGKHRADVGNPAATAFFRDAAPHADGKFNVAFADRHIEHGGVTVPPPDVAANPDLAVLANARQVGLAMIQYAQDYDEKLPPLGDAPQVRTLLLPYTRNADVFFSPATGLPFVFDSKFSGASLYDIPFPAQTVLFSDAVPTDDGYSAVGFADGQARLLRTAGYRPTLAVKPAALLGGLSATGTVTLNAPAQTGGVTVRLTSRSWAACVPATIFVPAGQRAAAFSIMTQPVRTETVANLEAATDREQHLGQLALHPASLQGLVFKPSKIKVGAKTTAVVFLTGPAPAGGATVEVVSTRALGNIVVGAGQTSGTLTLTARVPGSYTVSATWNGATKTAPLTVTP